MRCISVAGTRMPPGCALNVMSVMRGVAPFSELWQRRTTLEYDAGMRIELLSLPDLVCAKKTQRDKDWPMLRRLVEAHFFANRENPRPAQIAFWLRESRTVSMLLDLARLDRSTVTACLKSVRCCRLPCRGRCRAGDGIDGRGEGHPRSHRAYWLPLKAELERLRHPIASPELQRYALLESKRRDWRDVDFLRALVGFRSLFLEEVLGLCLTHFPENFSNSSRANLQRDFTQARMNCFWLR